MKRLDKVERSNGNTISIMEHAYGSPMVNEQEATERLFIPDLWDVAMRLRSNGDARAANAVLDCWYLCHDLATHIQCAVRDEVSP
jgi:hypothetical protein